jgi:hypothetical protein
MQAVRNSDFEGYIRNCLQHRFMSDNLEFLADSLHPYVMDCRRLEAHLETLAVKEPWTKKLQGFPQFSGSSKLPTEKPDSVAAELEMNRT